MRTHQLWLQRIAKLGLVLVLGASMSACAGFLGFGGTSWKEEVLLHDGSKIIVERSQSYGGRHEIGQSSPVKEHTITFGLPNSSKTVSWTSEYDDSLGRTNFNLLALHMLNGTPYVVAEPNLCLSYNKWGRPNPPYVFFKYDGKDWQRIPIAELPAEFKTFNVVIELGRQSVETLVQQGLVSAETVKRRNDALTQNPLHQAFLREPIPNVGRHCPIDIRTKYGWEGIGFFKYQPTYEACLNYCEQQGVSAQDCPCATLFKGK